MSFNTFHWQRHNLITIAFPSQIQQGNSLKGRHQQWMEKTLVKLSTESKNWKKRTKRPNERNHDERCAV